MKSRNIIKNLLVLFLVLILSACNIETEKETKTIVKTTPIVGTWKMTSIHWITKDTTYSIEKAQPGFFMFTPKRYAIMWTPIEEARTPFQNLS